MSQLLIPDTRARLPLETWREIGRILMFDSRTSADLKNFMISCKDAHVIGDPILFRRVLLGNETEIRNFAEWAGVLIQRKADLIYEIGLPDSFETDPTVEDTGLGQLLLASLPNLKEISIISKRSTPGTFWTPSMFKDLPFRLERLVGVFSNPDSTKALLAAQPHIRSWKAVNYDLPRYIQDCRPPNLEAVCFSVTAVTTRKIACSMPLEDKALRSHLIKVVIRGNINRDVIDSLLSYTALRSLSICMPNEPTDTQTNLLRRIGINVPTLVHLTVWTFGAAWPNAGGYTHKVDVLFLKRKNEIAYFFYRRCAIISMTWNKSPRCVDCSRWR